MFYGWRIVGGAFASHLFIVGFVTYSFSLLVPAVREEFGVGLEAVMYAMTGMTVLNLFVSPIAGILIDRVQVRWLMTSGVVLFGLGLYVLSMATSITAFVMIFGITASIATSLATTTATSAVISRWFTIHRGKALGIAAVGTSFGGILVPKFMATSISNDGWRVALESMSLAVLVILVPLVAILIRGKPSDVGLTAESSPAADSAPAEAGLTTQQIVRSRGFWFLGLSLGLLFSAYSGLMSNIGPFVADLGYPKESAATLLMSIAIAGLVGKVLFGMAADRHTPKIALGAAQLLAFSGFIVLAFQPSFPVLVIAAVMQGLASGGMLPSWGAMMALIFGVQSYGRAMGLMGPVLTLCIMPSYTLAGRIFDSTGSFTTVFLVFASMLIPSALLLLPLKLERI
jgi:MFS family permease